MDSYSGYFTKEPSVLSTCTRKSEDWGSTNNYIKHDTTDSLLYYISYSHCNIHIDHLWHDFINFEYACKYINQEALPVILAKMEYQYTF